jgi:hypothetical protein
MSRLREQARATFDISPSLFGTIGGVIIFMLAVIVILQLVA